ncbi:MAG TPA: hypothetical protein VF817_00765 [Patescibacteria group bacterium]
MHSDDPQIEAEKHRLQMEMILKDSDVKKNIRLRSELEVEIRVIKTKMQQLTADLASKESHLHKVEAELMQLQNEIIKLKHKSATLR